MGSSGQLALLTYFDNRTEALPLLHCSSSLVRGKPLNSVCLLLLLLLLSHFSSVQLFVTPWTVAQRSSIHGVLQARILECVAISSSRGSFRPRDQTHVSCLLHWQAGSLPLVPSGSPSTNLNVCFMSAPQSSFFGCTMQHVGSSSLIRDQTCALCTKG